jgi:phosphopantothenate synthetase
MLLSCAAVVLFCPAGICCVNDGIAAAVPAMIMAMAAAKRTSTVLFAMNNQRVKTIKEVCQIVQVLL